MNWRSNFPNHRHCDSEHCSPTWKMANSSVLFHRMEHDRRCVKVYQISPGWMFPNLFCPSFDSQKRFLKKYKNNKIRLSMSFTIIPEIFDFLIFRLNGFVASSLAACESVGRFEGELEIIGLVVELDEIPGDSFEGCR